MQIITKCFTATLFAALTMPVCSFAQEEAESREAVGIFDFNKFEHPVSSNDSHNGDITIVEKNIWRYVCTGPVEVADREIVEGDNNIAYVNVALLDNVVSAESIRGIIIRYGETYALEPVSVKNAITTGIETVSTMSQRMSVFSVSGRQYDTPRKGLNIVHTSNGSVQKILVK